MKVRIPKGMGGGPQNMNAMMRQVQKFQEEREALAADLESREYDIAAGGGSVVRHFFTMEEAMPTIHQLFTPGTTVLVKASHAMEFGKIVKELEETYQ